MSALQEIIKLRWSGVWKSVYNAIIEIVENVFEIQEALFLVILYWVHRMYI